VAVTEIESAKLQADATREPDLCHPGVAIEQRSHAVLFRRPQRLVPVRNRIDAPLQFLVQIA
jgi:hypothetical protein